MKKIILCLFLAALTLCGCGNGSELSATYADASRYGVLPENSGKENSENLQKLIDDLSEIGGTIYIPAGTYEFQQNGTQTIGGHCIKMRSNVSIIGDGIHTVLKPVGTSPYGLDMFYFNDYLDTGEARYLENCRFENFVIDASQTSCEVYTSAGKGFMFNLFRNCHWQGVTVMYSDGTGFGVDCPIDSTITNCTAIGCGKAATKHDPGASGFGIGYGYANGESIVITDCVSKENTKFGFFFEHQGRFDSERYALSNQGAFTVTGCRAENNLYNFGGICAENVIYSKCKSSEAKAQQVYFENCRNCKFMEE